MTWSPCWREFVWLISRIPIFTHITHTLTSICFFLVLHTHHLATTVILVSCRSLSSDTGRLRSWARTESPGLITWDLLGLSANTVGHGLNCLHHPTLSSLESVRANCFCEASKQPPRLGSGFESATSSCLSNVGQLVAAVPRSRKTERYPHLHASRRSYG